MMRKRKKGRRPTGGGAQKMYDALLCPHNEECFGIMRKIRNRLDYYNNHEEMLAGKKRWRDANREKHNATNREWGRNNKNRKSIIGQLYYENVSRPRILQKYRDARLECLRHYSGGTLKCVYCGYDRIEALQLDHINGDGAKKKGRNGRRAANNFIIIAREKPEGYQILCANCNYVKGDLTDTDFRQQRPDWFR